MNTPDDAMVHVIDDDIDVRESLDALLAVSGFDVVTYASAEEFLARSVEARGCLLLDVNMPGMGGLELQERLVREGRRLPVLYLTSNLEGRVRERAMELGALDFLAKPVTNERLLEAIAGALAADRQ